MLEKLLDLQMFADGGDGGDGGADASAEAGIATTGEEIPAGIPDRAKATYRKALAKTGKAAAPAAQEAGQGTEHPSYQDLIKSDLYKDEHKAYMERTIGDRLKKYKGIEESYGKAKAALDVVAQKYGVDPDSENFLDELNQKISADDSYYEDYAMEHDVSVEEARNMVTMQRKVQAIERAEEERRRQAEMDEKIQQLRAHAERTKQRFPGFDLETEFQDERFRRLCAVNNGDTTAAYMACHWQDILPAQAQMATRQAQSQAAEAVAAGRARPVENGLNSITPSVPEQSFKGWSLQQIRDYAAKERLKLKGR